MLNERDNAEHYLTITVFLLIVIIGLQVVGMEKNRSPHTIKLESPNIEKYNDSELKSILSVVESNSSARDSILLREIIKIQKKLGVEVDPSLERIFNSNNKVITVGKKEEIPETEG